MRQLNFLPLVVGTLIALGMSACSPLPSVKYDNLTQPRADEKGLIKFYLSSTDITLSTLAAKDNANEAKARSGVDLEGQAEIKIDSQDKIQTTLASQVKVILTPKEHRETLYMIIPQTSWLGTVSTRLAVTYFDTTDSAMLMKTIGSEVQDDRIKIISALSAAAGGIAAIAGYAPKSPPKPSMNLRLPVVIDSHEAKKKNGAWDNLPMNPGWWYKLDVSNHTPTAVQTSVFFKNYSVVDGSETAAFPFSACTRGVLRIRYKESQPEEPPRVDAVADASFNITFADPDYVDTLGLPAKGSIKFHTNCGADLETQKSDVKSAWDLVEALMNQVKSFKDKQK